MKNGIIKGSKPKVKKGTGKAMLHIVGVGLAAGLALITATDKGLRKVTGYKDEAEEVSEEAEEE
ncbi:MAG: hypothetical protein IJP00_00835 [Firmicutes bacterium]|nr:hypothetical protein [Bacillota bacterium]